MGRLRSIVAIVLGAAVVVAVIFFVQKSQRPRGPVVIANDGKPHYGKTHAEWATAWWKWTLETVPGPNCAMPLQDATGAHCALGQPADMFFLVGTMGGKLTRNACHVPRGRPLFLPLINTELDCRVGDQPARPDADVKRYLDDSIRTTHGLHLSVDGVAIPIDPAAFAVPGTKFFYDMPPGPNNSATCMGTDGVYEPNEPAFHSGHYVLLEPLAPGPHVIEFGGIYAGNDALDHPVDVRYELTVD